MKITILMNQAYPSGMACTNRVHLYAKRFKEQGHEVEIIIPTPTENHRTKPRNTQKKGVYDSVPFRYFVNPVRNKFFIIRRWNDMLSYFRTFGYIFTKKRDSDILLLVDTRLVSALLSKCFCVIFNCRLVGERSELPFVFAKKNVLIKFYQKIYEKYVFRWFNGIIVISESLYSYFTIKAGKKTALIIVPILTDSSVFKPTKKNSGEIVYAGVLNQFKDGILDLLQAYSNFTKKVPGKRLVLMGDINLSPDRDEINQFIEENDLKKNIEITGYVSRPAMIDRLTNAAVLILAKPATEQAEHCIPTKLAEYLSTGKPVLTTNTGSIPFFLTDKKDAYLTEPNNPSQMANKLQGIFSNYEEAELIGENGRYLALEQFEYKRQGDRIISFFEQISNKNK